MKFGILGYGFVGKATELGLSLPNDTVIHDLKLNTDRTILDDADVVFVCIPTVTQNDIDTVISEIDQLKADTVIIRSTLPVGTCKKINKPCVIYMPEFMRERHWKTDCLKRPLIVGIEGDVPNWLEEQNIYKCSLTEAELVKMFNNNLAVAKIAFANVFYELAQKTNSDYDLVKDAFFKVVPDQTYMEVPGPAGGTGFGGKCLPKDLDFLIDTLDEYDINQNWFKHIRDLNKEWTDV